MQNVYRYGIAFVWGYFFLLGVLAITHGAGQPPHTIGEAFAISIVGGLAGLMIRFRVDQVDAEDNR